MRRSTLARCCFLFLSLGFAACAAWQAQHGAPKSQGAGEAAAPAAAWGPVEAPGSDFTWLPEERQVSVIRGEVEETRTGLAAKGSYACCVRPACNACLLRAGSCHCRVSVRAGKPACGECTDGWIEGRGAVEGVTARELVERKRRALEGPPPP
jgi:hypothetical protein